MAEARDITVPVPAVAEWRAGWSTVLSGGFGMTAVAGVSAVTGVIMAPLEEAFGWSRALITANVMICAVLTLLLAPIVGQIVTRHGVRRSAVVGTLVSIPLLVAIGLNPGSAVWWIVSWIAFGVINTLLGPLIWSTAVTQLFDRSRGLALAITLSGGGLAFALFPPLALLVIGLGDWRTVYFAFAAMFGLVLLPILLAGFTGRHVRVTAPAGAAAGKGRSVLREALAGRHFWLLAAASLLVAGMEGAMAIHLYPILNEGGLAPLAAAGATSMMGGAMIAGRLGIGVLQDRFAARYVFVIAIAALLVSSLLAVIYDGSNAQALAISILLGLGAGGTINSLAYLAGRYFALSAYASTFGLLMGIFAVGYGVAPMVAAWFRDMLGGYGPVMPAMPVMLIVGAVLVVLMGPEPERKAA